MTLEELQQQLEEEKSKALALQEQLKSKEDKIKLLEKENSDFKLENTKLRTTNGNLLLKLDNASASEEKQEENTKSFEENVLDILQGGN